MTSATYLTYSSAASTELTLKFFNVRNWEGPYTLLSCGKKEVNI